MSLQYTLEIENFKQGQNITLNVDYVVFNNFSHLSPASVGMSNKTAEQVKEVTFSRSFDQHSHLFAGQNGKAFPKVALRAKNSSGKNYLYTFLNAYLESQLMNGSGDSKIEERIKCCFDKFSVKEDSPVGNTARPNSVKSSDKQQAAMMNFVKG